MEFGNKSNNEPFDPSKYWKNKIETLSSKQMSEVAKRRSKLFALSSEIVHGKPPGLSAEMIDTLMYRDPTKEEIEDWIFTARMPETNDDLMANTEMATNSVAIQTDQQKGDYSESIKKAAEKFEQSGGWKRYPDYD